jgi:iron complex transport system permease protein
MKEGHMKEGHVKERPGAATSDIIRQNKRKSAAGRRLLLTLFTFFIFAGFAASLMCGHTFYPPGAVLAVLRGDYVQGASFTVGVLRLPRATLAVLSGFCFGFAGSAFQTMLRNTLASPDIIGVSAGASAAAVFAIVALSLGAAAVSLFAVAAGIGVALIIYLLSYKSGTAGPRLILVGIGVAAILNSVTAYLMSQASQWNLQEALRWMTGSLNGTSWEQVLPVLFALSVFGPVLLSQSHNLEVSQLGDDAAGALGVRVNRMRLLVTLAAVGLISFATAATGPVAFVAFLSGPIAKRFFGAGGSNLWPAALVGTLLMLMADFLGQYALGARYPVGVVTGVLGAPYLIYLIIRANRGRTAS